MASANHLLLQPAAATARIGRGHHRKPSRNTPIVPTRSCPTGEKHGQNLSDRVLFFLLCALVRGCVRRRERRAPRQRLLTLSSGL
ncbi:hypothetical protein MRX96_029163 [Rhipicephalus microplus]